MSQLRGRVLCVEGNEDTRSMEALLFKAAGFEVRTAGGTDEAVRLACAEKFDLYLIAYKLSQGTGLELCRRLRELRPRTPILFWSALVYPKDRREALGAGADAFLKKPDDFGLLVETASALLRPTRG